MASAYKQKKLERIIYFSTYQVGLGIIISQGCCGETSGTGLIFHLDYSKQSLQVYLPVTDVTEQLKI